jgi:hypothetical protein
MISEFRVEKSQVHASLVLSTGAMRHGCFFVVSSVPHGGPERVGDLLNSATGFFPFQHRDGTTVQYNREHLVMVTLPVGLAEEEEEASFPLAVRCEVSILLSTGTSIEGTVFISQPAGRDRLSDYARTSKQFWYVVTSRGTVIINCNHIVELVEKGNP